MILLAWRLLRRAIVRAQNSDYIYHTTDLAALKYRLRTKPETGSRLKVKISGMLEKGMTQNSFFRAA